MTLGQLPFNAQVGTTAMSYYVITGLLADFPYTIGLTTMSDNVDLYGYPDAFVSAPECSSTNSGTATDSCTATSTVDGDLYFAVDGSLTTVGATFRISLF